MSVGVNRVKGPAVVHLEILLTTKENHSIFDDNTCARLYNRDTRTS